MTDPTVGTEVSLNIDSIKEIMDGFDPEALLPEMNTILDKVLIICRIAILVGPLLLLALGLIYLFLSPKEANYYLGYRTFFGMGSVQAWQFTQKVAGLAFTGLGGVLTLIMAIIAAAMGRMDQMAMVWRAVWCLVWEAALALLAVLAINGLVLYWFNRKGDLRKRSPGFLAGKLQPKDIIPEETPPKENDQT